MKFFIIGGYSCGNPGDEAILKSTLYRIQDQFPGSFFYIWCDNDDFKMSFDRPIRYRIVRWKLSSWMRAESFAAKSVVKLYTDLFPLSDAVFKALHHPPLNVVHALRDSDKVIFLGGGYLNSYYSLLDMNFLSFLSEFNNKPQVLFGQTLGPFEKKVHSRIASEIFRRAQAIVLRDESGEEAGDYKEKIFHGADHAVGFSPNLTEGVRSAVDSYFRKNDPETVCLGLNLRRWNDSRKYYPALARQIKNLTRSIRGRKVRWYFVPMETSRFCDDREEGEALADALGKSCSMTVVRERLSVEAKAYFISRLDLFFGMRLHSLILAVNAGVPSVGIYHEEYYRRKVCGLMEAFGLEKCLLPLERSGALADLGKYIFLRRDDFKETILRNKNRVLQAQEELMQSLLRN